MKLRFIPVLVTGLLATSAAYAQDSTAVNKPAVAAVKTKSYDQIITSKAISQKGLFQVHNVDGKYFFEIPDDILNREFLFTTRLSKVPTGSPRFPGDLMNAVLVTFEKAPGDKLFVKAVTVVDQADDSNKIAAAVKNATVAPIIMALDIKTRSTDNKASVIEVTDFYLKENLLSGFHASAKKQMGTGAPAADRSSILSMTSFPTNIEVKTMKTYSLGAAPAGGEGGATPSASAGVTFEISNSVLMLPKDGMKLQAYDPRVGFKPKSTNVFSDNQHQVDKRRFIIKNRLEVKPSDLAAYKAGKLVEPKEPLVYYIDPATPKAYRKYMIAGVNNWNKAFEAAGFKNAIIGKEWPENDPTMNLEDVRYRVIRYMPSSTPFLDNNIINDPRTGEIIQMHIGWSHGQVKTLHDWYMIQAGASDAGARSMQFNEDLMGALITAEISKTVGYTLGLVDNLVSSSTIPLARLRDKSYLAKNPFNNSIMDYTHYNYVAQPEDKVSRNGLIPQISEYDKWAIKWAYSHTGAKDFNADQKIRLKWIKDNVTSLNSLAYIPVTPGIKPTDITNPAAQWEDLSDNPVAAAELGIKNLKYVMNNLVKWTTTDGNTYYNTSDLYYTLVSQYSFFLRHAFTQIGGVQESIKSIEQAGDVYTPVSKEAQREAIAFLNKEAFNTPEWIFKGEVLNKFRKPAKKEEVTKMQEDALFHLLSADRLSRMNAIAMRYGSENVYTVDDMLTDLTGGLFAEIKNQQAVDGGKRYLQKWFVTYLVKHFNDSEAIPDPTKPNVLTGSDIPVALYSQLTSLLNLCKNTKYADLTMQAHVNYMADKIDNALNSKN